MPIELNLAMCCVYQDTPFKTGYHMMIIYYYKLYDKMKTLNKIKDSD